MDTIHVVIYLSCHWTVVRSHTDVSPGQFSHIPPSCPRVKHTLLQLTLTRASYRPYLPGNFTLDRDAGCTGWTDKVDNRYWHRLTLKLPTVSTSATRHQNGGCGQGHWQSTSVLLSSLVYPEARQWTDWWSLLRRNLVFGFQLICKSWQRKSSLTCKNTDVPVNRGPEKRWSYHRQEICKGGTWHESEGWKIHFIIDKQKKTYTAIIEESILSANIIIDISALIWRFNQPVHYECWYSSVLPASFNTIFTFKFKMHSFILHVSKNLFQWWNGPVIWRLLNCGMCNRGSSWK